MVSFLYATVHPMSIWHQTRKRGWVMVLLVPGSSKSVVVINIEAAIEQVLDPIFPTLSVYYYGAHICNV